MGELRPVGTALEQQQGAAPKDSSALRNVRVLSQQAARDGRLLERKPVVPLTGDVVALVEDAKPVDLDVAFLPGLAPTGRVG